MHNKQKDIVDFTCNKMNEKTKFRTKILIELKEALNPVNLMRSFPPTQELFYALHMNWCKTYLQLQKRTEILYWHVGFPAHQLRVNARRLQGNPRTKSLCVRIRYRDDYHGGWPNPTAQSKAGQWFGLVNCKLTLTLCQFILVKCHEASLSSRT